MLCKKFPLCMFISVSVPVDRCLISFAVYDGQESTIKIFHEGVPLHSVRVWGLKVEIRKYVACDGVECGRRENHK